MQNSLFMLTASNLYVQYGDRILLDRVNFVIGERERIGLVGRNGAGKSTLLKIIAGNLRPDEGNIARPSLSTLGFLHQEMSLPKGRSVIAETLAAFDKARQVEARLAAIHEELAHRTDYESDAYMQLLNEMSDLDHHFHLIGGLNMEAEAQKVLKGLGFRQEDFSRLTDEFSGGWQMRIELAKMLLQRPDYLLLDEPTNHLDIESILWLEEFLQTYEGSVVVISHDKTFLDNVTKRTLEIELGKLYEYKANYSRYVEMREERREKMMAAMSNQQKQIAQMERTINRFMAKASKTSLAQSMQKKLEKIDRIEVEDADTSVMNIRFPEPPRAGQIVMEAKGLSKSYGHLRVLDQVDFQIERGERVAFVGQNGQGKTTLAKILVGHLQASAGEVKPGYNVFIGYYAQNQAEALDPKLTLLETMEAHSPPEMRTRLRSILGAFLFSGEDQDKKVSVLSGGERARLAMACLLLRPINLLVLDEPTNHLDMLSKEVLKAALMDYTGTLIVVSHDRDFLSGLTDKTLEFRDKKLHTYLGDVNYFLDKRKLDNMRQVEIGGVSAPSAGGRHAIRELSHEERRQMQRQLSSAEKKVEQLEARISDLEARMALPDFFQKPDHQKVLQEYDTSKSQLESAMTEWLEAQEAMGN
jgi:ATP-binding cassette subfamily F protein 3